jgi:hypothetical protein
MRRIRQIGFMIRRGIAEVKYQRNGDVPQAEAPTPSSGKILAKKEESSGQSHRSGESD